MLHIIQNETSKFLDVNRHFSFGTFDTADCHKIRSNFFRTKLYGAKSLKYHVQVDNEHKVFVFFKEALSWPTE